MNPSEKTPKELTVMASDRYRSLDYDLANTLYAAAIANALVRILEILETPKVTETTKTKRGKAA